MVNRGVRRLLRNALLALGSSAVALVALRQLDYSRADLVFVTREVLEQSSLANGFEGADWDPTNYARAPELDGFREFVRTSCPQVERHELANCIVATMASRFRHGAPLDEFFGEDYQPSAALRAHLSGADGHCVTRAGLAATAMLSVGIPARVVQLVPRGHGGHNVFSFFDGDQWVLVDPTYGVWVRPRTGRTIASAFDVSDVTFERIADAPLGVEGDVASVYADNDLLGGDFVYPEPWLYARVGSRQARFPFSGRFVVVGARTWSVGWGQPVLALAFLAFLGLAAWFALRAALAWRAGRRPGSRGVEPGDVTVPIPVDAVTRMPRH